jgi:hypothetical protein
MTLLETSGIVDFAALPIAPNPAVPADSASKIRFAGQAAIAVTIRHLPLISRRLP